MLVAAVAMLAAAGWAYQRRDYAAGLWSRRPRAARPLRRVQRPALNRVWTATLLRQRVGLLTWALAAAAGMAMIAWLEPAVADMWDKFQYTQRLLGADPSHTVADQYLAMAGQFIVPIVIAYVLTQAAGWVADLREGRVELLLAAPCPGRGWSGSGSWPPWPARPSSPPPRSPRSPRPPSASAPTSTRQGWPGSPPTPCWSPPRSPPSPRSSSPGCAAPPPSPPSPSSSAPPTSSCTWYPCSPGRTGSTGLTIFGAYGNPYLELPAASGLILLAGMATIGSLLAATIAAHSPKAAT